MVENQRPEWEERRGLGGSLIVPEPSQDVDEQARAFREHVEPQIEVLFRVARSLTGNTADAEDLTQECLIRAYQAVHRFDGRHPRAWLLTILRHTHLNMHRRQRPVTIEHWDRLGDHRLAFGAATQRSPEDLVMDETLNHELEAALAALDPRFRETLLLVDVHGLTYADASAALGIPLGTVMSRLSRARDRVRAHLGPDVLLTRRFS